MTSPEPRESIVERLFHEALELPPEERSAFLESNAPDDEIRAEVLELLAFDAEPAAHLAATPDDFAAATGLITPSLTGRTIGPYRILEPIGQGGMGTIYRAVREDLGSRVALKVIRGALGDPIRIARFRQEQRVLARLEHEHIARLLDAGIATDETPYLVMEFVEGTPITTWCDERGLGIEERLRLFLDLCSAVAFAHRHAIVHRDLKPANVLVTAEGKTKLLDFGVAKLLASDDVDATLTATDVRILSPVYAAPEQVLGEAITTATDIYGLGTILYELLAGTPPGEAVGSGPASWTAERWEGIAPPSTAARRQGGSPASRARQVAGDLDAICLRALERDPARRYAAVELLRDDVERYLAGLPVVARLPTLGYRTAKFIRRNALGVATTAGILLLIAAGIAGVIWQARAAERARDDAEELAGFLVGLFQASDPGEMEGRTVTARELLEAGTARAMELDRRPEIQVRLLDAMARAHLGLGDYARADSLASLALERGREVLGERHPDFADRLVTLGRTRQAIGREVEAEDLLRRALALRRARLGARHDQTTAAMLDLSMLLAQHRGYGEAESLARAALDARMARHGPEADEVATALEVLASNLWLSGKDPAEAEALLRRAVATRERLHGPVDLRIANSLIALSALLPVVGKAEEAEEAARRAAEIRRAIYGDDHPSTIHVMNNVARALQAQRRPAEAREIYREILRRTEGLYPGDHPYIATVLNNLSASFYEENALDSAEHYLRQALEMRIRLYGRYDANVALYQHNLGSLQRLRGRLGEAEAALAESYELRRGLFGEDNPITLRTGAVYARVLAERGKVGEAEALLREILRSQRGDSDGGDADEVSTDAARTMGYLADLLARRGEYEEAEALFLPAITVARESMAPNHPRRRELVEGLASLYERWGRPEDAERIRREQ